ncbi:hypothetical protein HY993_00260, partial [Candidatus Micrarchaeota archaeon]|nr:hypothetical protein [Candidatus Micrarchaeota archaeon]
AKIKELLEDRAKQTDGKLEYEADNTLAYAGKFALSESSEKELLKSLSALGFNQGFAAAIANTLPKKESEVTAVGQWLGVEVSGDQAKEVLKLVKKAK